MVLLSVEYPNVCVMMIFCLFHVVCAHNEHERKITINVTKIRYDLNTVMGENFHVRMKLRVGFTACKGKSYWNVTCNNSIYWSEPIENERNFTTDGHSKVWDATTDDLDWRGIVVQPKIFGKDTNFIRIFVVGSLTEVGSTKQSYHCNATILEYAEDFEPTSTFDSYLHQFSSSNQAFFQVTLNGKVMCPEDHYGCNCERKCTPTATMICDDFGQKTCTPGSYPVLESLLEWCNGTNAYGSFVTKNMCERQCREEPEIHATCNICGFLTCHDGYFHTNVTINEGEADNGSCEKINCTWPPDSMLFSGRFYKTRCLNDAPCIERHHDKANLVVMGFYDCNCEQIATKKGNYYGSRCQWYNEYTTTTDSSLTEPIEPVTTTTISTSTSAQVSTSESVASPSSQNEPTSVTQTSPPSEEQNDKKEAGVSGIHIFFIVLFATALLVAISFVGFKAYKTYQQKQTMFTGATGFGHPSTDEPAVSISLTAASLNHDPIVGGIENPQYQPN